MNRILNPRSLAFATLAVAAACGGSAPSEGTTPASGSASAGAEDEELQPPPSTLPSKSAIDILGFGPPDKPWDDMSYDEREWYMVGKVHPVMREVFANYNARYNDFHCEPCHGPDGKEKKYKMPSDHLSAVPALDSPEFAKMQGSKLVKFMQEEVTVHTASLLGMPLYDPSTGEGFSCHNCHPKQ